MFPKDYDQHTFGHKFVIDNHGRWQHLDNSTVCQTPCCIAGHALVLEPPTEEELEQLKEEKLGLDDLAQKRLQFPDNIAHYIYGASWLHSFFLDKDGPTTPETPNAEQAVAFLNAVLKGKFDNWDIWDEEVTDSHTQVPVEE